MYMEGSSKAFLAVLFAILLAVSLAFWHQTLFVLKFLSDLIQMNARDQFHNLLQYLREHWPFSS